MKLNINHYIRLKQIAVFMPDVFSKKNEYGSINESREYVIPVSMKEEADHLSEAELMIIDAAMTGKKDPEIYQEALLKTMQISEFEIVFFEVCMKLYKKLQSIFFPIKDTEKETVEQFFQADFGNGPIAFYESIPHDKFILDEIREKTYEMFNSVRSASKFYYEFNQIQELYDDSAMINKGIKMFPPLKHLKTNLYEILSKYPTDFSPSFFVYLSDIVQSIKPIIEHGSEPDEADIEDSLISAIINSCFDFLFTYSAPKNSGNSERNNAISQKKLELNSKRREKVSKYLKPIFESLGDSPKRGQKKTACEQCFRDNESELKELGIKSAKTLQRYLSQENPNKQRSDYAKKKIKDLNTPPLFRIILNIFMMNSGTQNQ